MKRRIFALCDPDADYTGRLSAALRERENFPFEMQAFTGKESLVRYAEKNPVEVLMISKGLIDESVRELQIGLLISLRSEGGTEDPNELQIFRYQSVSETLGDILRIYARCRPDEVFRVQKKNTRVLGIYSPVGRCMKTTFALCMGQLLAEKRSTLFLSLESFYGYEELSGGTGGDLSDLLYYAGRPDFCLAPLLGSLVRRIAELDFIPPVRNPLDIMGMTDEKLKEVLKILMEQTSYEIILLDIGSGGEGLLSLLGFCERIYMPAAEDPAADGKLKQFRTWLKESGEEALSENILEIRIPMLRFPKDFSLRDLVYTELGRFSKELIRKEGL